VEGSAVGSLDGSPILSTSASPVRWPATPRTSRQCFTLALPPAPEPASGRLAGTRSDGCWVRLGSGVPMRSGVAWSTAADAAPSPTARLPGEDESRSSRLSWRSTGRRCRAHRGRLEGCSAAAPERGVGAPPGAALEGVACTFRQGV